MSLRNAMKVGMSTSALRTSREDLHQASNSFWGFCFSLKISVTVASSLADFLLRFVVLAWKKTIWGSFYLKSLQHRIITCCCCGGCCCLACGDLAWTGGSSQKPCWVCGGCWGWGCCCWNGFWDLWELVIGWLEGCWVGVPDAAVRLAQLIFETPPPHTDAWKDLKLIWNVNTKIEMTATNG